MNDILDIQKIDGWLCKEQADLYFSLLKQIIPWTGDRITQSGEKIKIKRQMAYFSESGEPYNYAGMELVGNKLTSCMMLEAIRWELESTFLKVHPNSSKKPRIGPLNSVLLNLYEDGKSEIRWHSDKEPQLGDSPIIPCVNLGATRKFWFLEKSTGNKFHIEVKNGDLLVMGPNCQKNYLHAILKETDVKEPRISLTYRYVYGS